MGKFTKALQALSKVKKSIYFRSVIGQIFHNSVVFSTLYGDGYSYGFNGMEKDDEHTQGKYDFGARIYDSRLGRWLAIDRLAVKHTGHSPFIYCANNPIIYLDPDGNDIRYFDENGDEIVALRVVSDEVFETYVRTNVVHYYQDGEWMADHTFEKAKMPDRITNYTDYEKKMGYDYNKYDYQIAAEVFIFNKKLANGELPEKTVGAGSPSDVPDLDPNTIKAMIIKETNAGNITGGFRKGNKDVAQVNVTGDWDKKKGRIGLTENASASPQESIQAGILWLYWKGVTVQNLAWENGKIVSGDVTWTGGDGWMTALKRYNGGGDVNYMDKVNKITDALEEGKSAAYKKQEDDQKKEEKKKNEKKKKKNDDG